MSLGLEVFHRLCETGNALEVLREPMPPGSDAWCALTEFIQRIDQCIDVLVESAPLEDAP